MNKASHFLFLVQTAVLTKYVTDRGDGTAPMARPMWAMEHVDDACKVAERIPGDITALDAAQAFVRWLFHEEKQPDDQAILEILIGDGI